MLQAEEKWRKISSIAKLTFVATMLVGFFSHIVVITNFILNHDSLFSLYRGMANRIYLGRWCDRIFSVLTGEILQPAICVSFGIIFIAISAAIIVRYLEIQSKFLAIAIGAGMVLFPTVASTNTYYLVSLTYFGSLLLATLGVYCADRGRKGVFLSVLLLTLSLGTYQAYISFAAGVFVLRIILDLLNGSPAKACLRKGLKYIGLLLVSILSYYLILKIILITTNAKMTNYRGLSNMDNISILNIPTLIVNAYTKVIAFFLFDQYGENTIGTAALYVLTCVLFVVGIIYLMIKKRLFRDTLRTVLLVVALLVFPLAIHAIAVLSQNANTHWLMIYAFVLVYVSSIAVIDQVDRTTVGLKKFSFARSITLAMVGVSLLQCLSWYITTNTCYTYLRLSNQAAYAKVNQIYYDLLHNGYTADIPLAIVGEGDSSFFKSTLPITRPPFTGITEPAFVIRSSERMYEYLRSILGMEYTRATNDEIERAMQNEEVQFMPSYPEQGSIQMIDGIMVLKLSALEGELVDVLENDIVDSSEILFDEAVNIQAKEDEKNKYSKIGLIDEPNQTYHLELENIKKSSGSAQFVSVILYQRSQKKVILSYDVPLSDNFEMTFRTTELVNKSDNSLEILIYAGEKGKTQSNTIQIDNVTLSKVMTE